MSVEAGLLDLECILGVVLVLVLDLVDGEDAGDWLGAVDAHAVAMNPAQLLQCRLGRQRAAGQPQVLAYHPVQYRRHEADAGVREDATDSGGTFGDGAVISSVEIWGHHSGPFTLCFEGTMVRTIFATACLFGLVAAPAAAGVLNFSGDICGGPCAVDTSFTFISNDYGDIPGQLDVRYAAAANVPNLLYWKNGYGGLDGVAYGDVGSAEIFFKPERGFSVTLKSFQLGAFEGDYQSRATVSDGLGNVLFNSGTDPITILGSTPSTFAGSWTSSEGIKISFGPDAFYVGIDNITFDVAAVPEPALLILVATALAGLWCFRRRPASRQGAAVPVAHALG